jgi:glutaredoxin-like YruB-family protein
MAVEHVTDSKALLAELAASPQPSLLGFFGDFSAIAQRVRPTFERFCEERPGLKAYLVDVTVVKDVHPNFGVSAVPAVLLVEQGKASRHVIGASTADDFARLLEPRTASGAGRPGEGKAAHRVTVFTTPSCSWCTRVKSYLSGRGVSYTEVNVAKDERAMQRMVARSGQMGVPQLDIDGRMIVGFDKARIDQALGLGAGSAS